MLAWLCGKVLRLFGWKIVGEPPQINKYVAIVAPHTSNWDFFIFILMKFALRLSVNFIGKHTIFVGPVGTLLKRWGGIPLDRSTNQNVVQSIVDEFAKRDKMIFALSPEGTRSYRDHWKSGFYHIAYNAAVPLQLCFLDKPSKSVGFGPLLTLSGDLQNDLALIREFYLTKQGIRPELFSRIAFKDKQ